MYLARRGWWPRNLNGSSGVLLAFLMILISCAPSVTESDEYGALEAERDEALAASSEASRELSNIETELAEAEDELKEADAAAAGSEARIEELEVAIEEEATRIDPYPPLLADAMIEGCAGGDPSLLPTCTCAVDELQDEMPIAQLFEITFRVEELPVDPETGLPDAAALARIPGGDTFFQAFFDCLFVT